MDTILKVMFGILAIVILWTIYEMIGILLKDRIIIVNKDGSLSFYNKKLKGKNRIEIEKKTYPLDSKAVHTIKGLFFWKKVYIFDEGSVMPRKILFKKDVWADAGTITKIINDEQVMMLSKKAIDPGTKLFIIFGAVGGILASISSAVLLAMELGLIK